MKTGAVVAISVVAVGGIALLIYKLSNPKKAKSTYTSTPYTPTIGAVTTNPQQGVNWATVAQDIVKSGVLNDIFRKKTPTTASTTTASTTVPYEPYTSVHGDSDDSELWD